MFNFFRKDYEFQPKQIDIHIDWRKFFNIEDEQKSYVDFVSEMENKYGEKVGLSLGHALRISLLDINEQGLLVHFWVNPTNFCFKYISNTNANIFIKTGSPEELINIFGQRLPLLAINSTIYGLEFCVSSNNGKERPDIGVGGKWETLTIIPHMLLSTDRYLLGHNATEKEFQEIENKFNMELDSDFDSDWWSNDMVQIWIKNL